MTIHPDDVPEGGNFEDLIIKESDVDGLFRLQEGIRMVMVDGHHRH